MKLSYKSDFIFVTILISLLIFLFYTCDKKSTPPEDTEIIPIEPEMVLIDEDLTFTYGEIRNLFGGYDSLFILTLEPYYMAKYELTNLEYYKFVKDSGYYKQKYWSEIGWEGKVERGWILPLFWDERNFYKSDVLSNQENTPVHGISYHEAVAYCNWLSEKTGECFEIPSFAQWQRAAKGPDPGFKYPWGNEWNDNNMHLIYYLENYTLIPVYSLPEGKSYDGCFNMVGNVYEFVTGKIPTTDSEYDTNWISNSSFPNQYLENFQDIKKSHTCISIGTKISINYIGTFGRIAGLGVRISKTF